MIFFDYEKIYLLSCGKPSIIIRYLKYLRDEPEASTPIKGLSFIVNEDVVINNPLDLPPIQLAEYLGVLSMRNYSDYRVHGITSLNMLLVYPWVPRQIIESNPLIQIEKDTLKFKQEEIKYD